MSDRSETATHFESVRDALEFCLRREHLRQTATIALCVGTHRGCRFFECG